MSGKSLEKRMISVSLCYFTGLILLLLGFHVYFRIHEDAAPKACKPPCVKPSVHNTQGNNPNTIRVVFVMLAKNTILGYKEKGTVP